MFVLSVSAFLYDRVWLCARIWKINWFRIPSTSPKRCYKQIQSPKFIHYHIMPISLDKLDNSHEWYYPLWKACLTNEISRMSLSINASGPSVIGFCRCQNCEIYATTCNIYNGITTGLMFYALYVGYFVYLLLDDIICQFSILFRIYVWLQMAIPLYMYMFTTV